MKLESSRLVTSISFLLLTSITLLTLSSKANSSELRVVDEESSSFSYPLDPLFPASLGIPKNGSLVKFANANPAYYLIYNYKKYRIEYPLTFSGCGVFQNAFVEVDLEKSLFPDDGVLSVSAACTEMVKSAQSDIPIDAYCGLLDQNLHRAALANTLIDVGDDPTVLTDIVKTAELQINELSSKCNLQGKLDIGLIPSQLIASGASPASFTGLNYQGGKIVSVQDTGEAIVVANGNYGLGGRWFNFSLPNNNITTGAKASALGAGAINTQKIVKALQGKPTVPVYNGSAVYAAYLASASNIQGYYDWYLPSLLEVQTWMPHAMAPEECTVNAPYKVSLPGSYWTSTEQSSGQAYFVNCYQYLNNPDGIYKCAKSTATQTPPCYVTKTMSLNMRFMRKSGSFIPKIHDLSILSGDPTATANIEFKLLGNNIPQVRLSYSVLLNGDNEVACPGGGVVSDAVIRCSIDFPSIDHPMIELTGLTSGEVYSLQIKVSKAPPIDLSSSDPSTGVSEPGFTFIAGAYPKPNKFMSYVSDKTEGEDSDGAVIISYMDPTSGILSAPISALTRPKNSGYRSIIIDWNTAHAFQYDNEIGPRPEQKLLTTLSSYLIDTETAKISAPSNLELDGHIFEMRESPNGSYLYTYSYGGELTVLSITNGDGTAKLTKTQSISSPINLSNWSYNDSALSVSNDGRCVIIKGHLKDCTENCNSPKTVEYLVGNNGILAEGSCPSSSAGSVEMPYLLKQIVISDSIDESEQKEKMSDGVCVSEKPNQGDSTFTTRSGKYLIESPRTVYGKDPYSDEMVRIYSISKSPTKYCPVVGSPYKPTGAGDGGDWVFYSTVSSDDRYLYNCGYVYRMNPDTGQLTNYDGSPANAGVVQGVLAVPQGHSKATPCFTIPIPLN